MPQNGRTPIVESVEDVVDENELEGVKEELPTPQILQLWNWQHVNQNMLHWVDDAARNNGIDRVRHDLEIIVQAAEDAINVLERIEEAAAAPRHACVGSSAEPQIEPDVNVEGAAAACMRAGPADWAKEPVDFSDFAHKPIQSGNPSGPSCSTAAQGSRDIPVAAASDDPEKLNYADLAVQALSLPVPSLFSSNSDLKRKPSDSKKRGSHSRNFNRAPRDARQRDQIQPNSSNCSSESQVSVFDDLIAEVLNISAIAAVSRQSAATAEALGATASSSSFFCKTRQQQRQPADEGIPKIPSPPPRASRDISKQREPSLLQPSNSACEQFAQMTSYVESAIITDSSLSDNALEKCPLKPEQKIPNKTPLEHDADKSCSLSEDTDDALIPEDKSDEKTDD